MSDYFFRRIAENFLSEERSALASAAYPTVPVIINWRGHHYVGLVQPLPSRWEIAYVEKSPQMDERFMDALRELDPGRHELSADESIDLDDSEFFLRQNGDRLEPLEICDIVYLTQLGLKAAFDDSREMER